MQSCWSRECISTCCSIRSRIAAVIGGFHLADSEPAQMEESVGDLKALGPKLLLPGYCTGWRAKYKIEEGMPGRLAPSVVGTRFRL